MSWPAIGLMDVCRPKQWPTIPKSELVASGYPVYGANGRIGFYSEYNHEEPTILITCRGATCGTINVCDAQSYVTGNSMALDDLDRDRVDLRFMVYALQRADFGGVITGVAQPQITRQTLSRLQIHLPPLAEQKRIAGILDAADALRAKRREALAQLDTLLQATFLDFFGDPVTNPKGWKRVSFPDVVYFQEGPGVRNWQFRDAGIKLINVRNIVDSELDLENTERHLDPQEVEDKYSHFLLDDGDLVMSSSGVTWGKIAYVRREHLPLCLNTSMIRLRPANGTVVHSFINAFVRSESFRRQIIRLITGSAQPNFGPSHLKKLEIGLPPLDVQERFESIVASIEVQRTAQRTHLAELDTLFASLQSRAFRGGV